MGKISTAEVLRLRATSAVSPDQSVRRCAQDDDSAGEPEEKQQVPPLRFAPVGMTISFKLEDFALKIYKVTDSQDDESAGV
jgi:hypothetical protein